ncbi:Zinc finger, C3HC4 type (RING finger) [Musa troglodytarum]|nr:Zinc finger, C3HC4 type (RING finger) [Musa troglodytarum]URE27741.1 Zinc finger, C3HC4 type (RING finger) [Musa troglodytarum]URE27745.1 Zinc finger, C3HC4 type (RING finger) [Musa troglodytarum]URE27746.1 Zinc finger, C3HC4 type (RING finger) [Musa troglodytarum]URE27747.1 Zinc finger, C3HC4 type (RING finger) [Musa troglodytarum]
MGRSRSSIGTFQDLELRLGLSPLYKGQSSAASFTRGCPEFILIEDDDDDVQMYPPSSGEAIRFDQYTSSLAPTIREDDLELRLGVGASNFYPVSSNGWNDTSEDGYKDPNAWKSGKASSSQYMSNIIEVKLRCAICMDTMKEETTTTCGHVFCKACIISAIRVQKRCPTCREKLSQSNIHRIYLPGSTS